MDVRLGHVFQLVLAYARMAAPGKRIACSDWSETEAFGTERLAFRPSWKRPHLSIEALLVDIRFMRIRLGNRQLLALPLVAMLAVLAKSDDEVGEHADYILRSELPYSETIASLTLDLYSPRNSSQPLPCVVVIQGGGFNAQSGEKFRPFAERLASEGFASALIAYRGRPDDTYRKTVSDTKTAVRFLRRYSSEYGIDPDRIGAMGRSAGGTLVALLAFTDDDKEWLGDPSHSRYSSRIKAGVGYAGVYDFVARFEDQAQLDLQSNAEAKIASNGEWIGEEYSPSSPAWLEASATTHLDSGDPAMLLLHCKDDGTVPWLQSRDLFERMRKLNLPVEIELYKKGGHGFRTEDQDEPIVRMIGFLRRHL